MLPHKPHKFLPFVEKIMQKVMNDEILTAKVIELGQKYPNAKYTRVSRDPSIGCFTGCKYDFGIVQNGPETEGCLYGQALRELGYTFSYQYGIFDLLHREFPGVFTFEQLRKHQHVQAQQDNGATWGNAIKYLL